MDFFFISDFGGMDKLHDEDPGADLVEYQLGFQLSPS